MNIIIKISSSITTIDTINVIKLDIYHNVYHHCYNSIVNFINIMIIIIIILFSSVSLS